MSSTVRGTKAFRQSKWSDNLGDLGENSEQSTKPPKSVPMPSALKDIMNQGPSVIHPTPVGKKDLPALACFPPLAEENFPDGGSEKEKKKYTVEAIEQRRKTVLEMTMRGITAGTIAQQLGVHRNTIVSDLRSIRDHNREAMERTDVMEEIGGAARFYDMIQQESMYGMTTNKHPMV